jgi:hypothetical protein
MGQKPELEQLTAALDTMRAALAKAEPQILDEKIRQELRFYTALLDKSHADVMVKYPIEVANLERQMEQTRQRAAATQRGLAELLAQAAAAKDARQAAAGAPKTPAEPIDPELGRTLRDELLERFGDGKASRGKARPLDAETRDFLRNQRF